MKKILHVIGYLGVGGDSTAVSNVQNYVLKNNLDFQFDYVTHEECNLDYVEKIRKLGSKVYILPGDVRKLGALKYYREIKKVLVNSNYDVIHFHTSFQSFVGLMAAKRCHIKKRICHSHTSSIQRKVNPILKRIIIPFCRFFIKKMSTDLVACSDEAKYNLFGYKGKCNVIYNGLDTKLLKLIDEEKISYIKKKNNLYGKKVIGQVGRLSDMKNPLFSLELAKRFKDTNYVFVFLGDGVLKNIVNEKIKKEQLDNVLLLGAVNDVNNYMYIFDYLILPSKYGEGLPVVLIEQQIVNNKCLCISSDSVTKEANLGNVVYLPIDLMDEWEKALKDRKIVKNILPEKEAIFDIDNTSVKWLNLYR